jgi:branched-chain amino acid aminotransferase
MLLTRSLRSFGAQARLAAATFKAADLQVHPVDVKKMKPGEGQFKYGQHFTDHMLCVDWDKENGWHAP